MGLKVPCIFDLIASGAIRGHVEITDSFWQLVQSAQGIKLVASKASKPDYEMPAFNERDYEFLFNCLYPQIFVLRSRLRKKAPFSPMTLLAGPNSQATLDLIEYDCGSHTGEYSAIGTTLDAGQACVYQVDIPEGYKAADLYGQSGNVIADLYVRRGDPAVIECVSWPFD